MSDSTAPDDRLVEEALRSILAPLDRHLDRVNRSFALALIVLVPSVFLGLWLPQFESGRRSLGWAAGVFGLVVLMGLGLDALLGRLGRHRFNRRFPQGSAERNVALRILAEMETPNKAEEKLRDALANNLGERIVRHRRDRDEVETNGHHTSNLGGSGLPPTDRRPGGYYDYIPLEPRTAEEQQGSGVQSEQKT